MLLDIIAFCVGVVIGFAATWGYMQWQWKHNPYKFKTIVDGVIAYRETKEK